MRFGEFADDSGMTMPPAPSQAAADAHAVASTPSGQRLLAHLRARTTDRGLAPTATEAELRHLEGQRDLFRYIQRLITQAERGA